MASYAKCLLFLLFAISLSLQIHARESKFFSKVTKTTKKNDSVISLSPAISPTLAPALSPEPEVNEHGYGLYGRDPYENTPTKTVMPTKKTISGEQEKYVPAQELSQTENNYGDNYGQGYPTTPGYHYPPNSEKLTKNTILGNEKNVPAQELSQTENNGDNYGQGYGSSYLPQPVKGYPTTPGYPYPPESEMLKKKKNVPAQELSQTENYGVNLPPSYANPTTPGYPHPPGSEMLKKNTVVGDEKYVHFEQSSNSNVNGNKYEYSPSTRNPVYGEHKYVSERQGMSDTRFLENGKYYYDVNQDSKDVNQGNGYDVPTKQGMSDTRFMENGKYFYDVQNEQSVKGDRQAVSNANHNVNDHFQEQNNGMVDTRYLDNGKHFYGVNNNENVNTKETKGNYGGPKKFPNEYDTMEEYDREQGYIDPQDVYVP